MSAESVELDRWLTHVNPAVRAGSGYPREGFKRARK
jgi:hypothetical protein